MWLRSYLCRVDHLYAFFVQWSPDIYGGDDEIDPKERGFVVIEEKEDEELDIIDGHFSGSRLVKQVSKDWEVCGQCAEKPPILLRT